MERDFAEDLDDLICAPNLQNFENYKDVALVIFGVWILVAVIVYLVANFLVQSSPSPVNPPITEINETKPVISTDNEAKINKNEEIKVVKQEFIHEPVEDFVIKPYIEEKIEAPKCLGSDLEAVAWIETCLENIYGSTVLRTCLVDLWLDSMTKYIRTLDTEEDLELSFEGVLPNERNLKIINLVTQVHPSDNMVSLKYVLVSLVIISVDSWTLRNALEKLVLMSAHS